jgi:hypothetical protein
MKISKLIESLNKLKEQCGDTEISITEGGIEKEIISLVVSGDDFMAGHPNKFATIIPGEPVKTLDKS